MCRHTGELVLASAIVDKLAGISKAIGGVNIANVFRLQGVDPWVRGGILELLEWIWNSHDWEYVMDYQ